mgnify:CR=1 FL=1
MKRLEQIILISSFLYFSSTTILADSIFLSFAPSEIIGLTTDGANHNVSFEKMYNPHHCKFSDKYTITPAKTEEQKNSMLKMLLTAKLTGKKVGVRLGGCAGNHRPQLQKIYLDANWQDQNN